MNDDDKEPKMSESDRRLAEHTADIVVERIFKALQSDEIAGKVMETWGGKVDQVIGRGLRRLGLYLIMLIIGVGAMKFGLWEKFFSLMKP